MSLYVIIFNNHALLLNFHLGGYFLARDLSDVEFAFPFLMVRGNRSKGFSFVSCMAVSILLLHLFRKYQREILIA